MKKGDLSKFIEEAVRWRILHHTVGEARGAFADVSPDVLQKMIDEAVEDVRARRDRSDSALIRIRFSRSSPESSVLSVHRYLFPPGLFGAELYRAAEPR
jgi:hypothetical protein